MKLTKKELNTLEAISTEIDGLMEETWKKKRNKRLYAALGQARMVLEVAKRGGIIEKFLIVRAW